MRYLAAVAILISCFLGVCEKATAAERLSQATRAYNNQITAIAGRAINSEVTKHPERLSGVSMKLLYNVDQRGRVHNVRVVSGKPDRWAEKTAVRVLEAIKFPPIPKNVLQDLGMDHIEAAADVSYQVELQPPATENVDSAHYKYDTRVHKMLQDEVKPIFSAQGHRLEVDYEFYLDPQGRVTDLHADAKAGGRWAERAIAESIRAVKFPPVPPKVFEELKQKPPLKIYGTMTWDPKG
jgi:hypothetical protein